MYSGRERRVVVDVGVQHTKGDQTPVDAGIHVARPPGPPTLEVSQANGHIGSQWNARSKRAVVAGVGHGCKVPRVDNRRSAGGHPQEGGVALGSRFSSSRDTPAVSGRRVRRSQRRGAARWPTVRRSAHTPRRPRVARPAAAPTSPPARAAADSNPLARPRLAVGNISGPYTPMVATARPPHHRREQGGQPHRHPRDHEHHRGWWRSPPCRWRPPACEPHESPQRPTQHHPRPAGVLVPMMKSVTQSAEKPRSVFRKSCLQLGAGAAKHIDGQRQRHQHPEPPHREAFLGCGRRIDVRGLEALRFGQVPGNGHHQRHQQHRPCAHQPPAPQAQVGQRQQYEDQAGTERKRHGLHAHRVGPHPAWAPPRPTNTLASNTAAPDRFLVSTLGPGERTQARAERAQRARACGHPQRTQRQAPSPLPVGQGHDRQRDHHPGANDRQCGGLRPGGGDAEVVGGEGEHPG
jgi:hypothetical protein